MHSILLFAKAPRIGTVKTRLAAQVGKECALKVYKQLVERQLTAFPEHSKIEIHYTPSDGKEEMVQWLGNGFNFIPQAEGDLGQKLLQAINQSFESGSTQVLCIGGDCPALDFRHIDEALNHLNHQDTVFGPTTDGGYYLVGLNAPTPEIFRNIPWSTENTLQASLNALRESGKTHALLEELYDIDHKEDWLRAQSEQLLPD